MPQPQTNAALTSPHPQAALNTAQTTLSHQVVALISHLKPSERYFYYVLIQFTFSTCTFIIVIVDRY